ncbi:MAG: hypothetical protein M3N23_07195, partial [Pseudomonadota bacterium]|nr:hypothetical protein [Pseudomonadota bacterium]
MAELQQAIALVDKRPFFERALAHGVRTGTISPTVCAAIITDGAKGTVQVAEHFGTSHLQADLENARRRIVSLVSLYLDQTSDGDLARAAQSLQDNSFLFHSRSGNDMLKHLYALPDSTISGDMKSQSLTDFQDERTLVKPFTRTSYRKELKRRQDIAAVIAAAHWFCGELDVAMAALDFIPLEAIIRTALLMRLTGGGKAPSHREFAERITQLRAAHPAGGKLVIPKTLLDDVPAPHHAVAETVRRDIEKHDGAQILHPAAKLDALLNLIEARYFLRETDLDDVDSYAGFVSEAWRAATGGHDDPYSRLTLFMCLATGAKPKTSVTEAEARSMIRKVRKQGVD